MADPNGDDGASAEAAVDGFILEEMFPDFQNIFAHEYIDIDAVKDVAVVSFDTNVLLAPYKIGSQSFQEFLKILRTLKEAKRLILTAHVAREYARRRQGQLADLVKTLRDKSSRAAGIVESQSSFLDDDQDYKKAREFSEKIEKSIKDGRKYIDKVIEKLMGPVNGDPIYVNYKDVFSDIVIDLKVDDKAALREEIKARYKAKIPPGYKDASKGGNAEGDALIWKTLLQIGATHKQHLIFVTGDEKGDWYTQGGGSAFQPRIELIDEYARSSEGKTLHIVPLHKIMKLYGAPAEAVDAAREAQVTAPTSTTISVDAWKKLLDNYGLVESKLIERERKSPAPASIQLKLIPDEGIDSLRWQKNVDALDTDQLLRTIRSLRRRVRALEDKGE